MGLRLLLIGVGVITLVCAVILLGLLGYSVTIVW